MVAACWVPDRNDHGKPRERVWIAAGDTLNAIDPASGETVRSIHVAAHAGTAFDGQHLFQLAEDRIQKIDPATGRQKWKGEGIRRPKREPRHAPHTRRQATHRRYTPHHTLTPARVAPPPKLSV